jgi:SSS family solute:Na+ symporter
MNANHLGPWSLAIFLLCLGAILWIGWTSRRRSASANEYLNASHSVSLWVATIAFLVYNCGSIEVVGMSAMAAQYGVQALHFYWIGGIPGMVFLAMVVLPVYIQAGARSLPEYLGMRFGPHVRLLNACMAIFGSVCFAGIATYTLAEVLHVIVGWSFLAGGLTCSTVVLIYVLFGGVRASILTSVFQFFVMIAGLAPLLFFTIHFDTTTWSQRSLRWHLWKPLPWFSPHAPLDRFGVLLGLGFAINFSYWCTDFVMIQRTLAARSIEDARMVPLLAGFGKMGIAFLVVLPGVAAPSLLRTGFSFDQTMPALMALEFKPALLALGIAALLAGLMAWLAGNVSGFAALWAEEIYHRYLRPDATEQQTIRTGRIAVPVCLALAQLAAYATFRFRDIMEFLQLIAALFYVPTFAVVLTGLLNRRVRERSVLAGVCAGLASALALQCSFWMGWIRFGSQMTANFYGATVSFIVAAAICMLNFKRQDQNSIGAQAVFEPALCKALQPSPALLLLSIILLGLCGLLNILWW